MEGREKDQRRAPGGERIETLVDEALREVAAPAAVDLRPGVMAAWDERTRRLAAGSPPGVRRGRWLALPLLRPAAVLAGIVVLVAASLLVWQQVRPDGPAQQPARAQANVPAAPAPAPSREERGQAPLATPTDASSPAASRPAASVRAAARRPGRPLVEVEFPVEQVTADLLSLPGAPAGELGGGIPALPGSLSIPIAPIGPAPTVSDMSRPVSDFPVDDSHQPPGAEHGEPGQSGGPRR